MPAEVLRRSQQDDRLILLVQAGVLQYYVRIVPIHDHNGRVSGWRAWTALHQPTYDTADDALASVMTVLEQLQQPTGGQR